MRTPRSPEVQPIIAIDHDVSAGMLEDYDRTCFAARGLPAMFCLKGSELLNAPIVLADSAGRRSDFGIDQWPLAAH